MNDIERKLGILFVAQLITWILLFLLICGLSEISKSIDKFFARPKEQPKSLIFHL